MYLLIIFINQIDHHFHHHILLFCAALGNHQCESDEGVVSNALESVLDIELLQ